MTHDLHLAHADIGPAHFHALGLTAEQATAAVRAALEQFGDDLDVAPEVIGAVTICVMSGPPGTAFRDCRRYPGTP